MDACPNTSKPPKSDARLLTLPLETTLHPATNCLTLQTEYVLTYAAQNLTNLAYTRCRPRSIVPWRVTKRKNSAACTSSGSEDTVQAAELLRQTLFQLHPR